MRKYWCVVLVFMIAVFWGVKTYGEENKEEVIIGQKAVQNEEQQLEQKEEQKVEKKEEQKQEQKADQKEEEKAEKKEAVPLEKVVVEEKKKIEGTAGEGYRESEASMGPLGTKEILDTPYSISVVPSDLIENVQATTLKEVTKYLPSMQLEERQRPQTRGFQGSVSENNRIDGMNIAATTPYPMEQFEQIEVLNGLAGSLYGPGNPSGIFNFVLKRPIDTPLYQLNLNYITQSNFTGHVDLGGPIGKKFGYRVNLLYGDGEGYVDQSNLRRLLASVALDWRVFKNTVAELNYSYYHFNQSGYPAGFSYASNIQLPDAPDPTKGYGQVWANRYDTNRIASLRVKHDFNQDWHLTAGFLYQDVSREGNTVSNTFIDNNGNYRTTAAPLSAANAFEVYSEILYLNGRVKTGSLTHDLSLGTNGHQRSSMSPVAIMDKITLGTANIANPVSYNEPALWVSKHLYKTGISQQQALTVGDTVTFNKSWSAMLTASQSWFRVRSFDKNGHKTSKYNDDGISPAVSVMYKPFENMTAYITYADSLQQGATAPTTAANANETLAPYRSEQWEGGLKVALGKMNLSGAIFRIERPFPYTGADNVFKIQGNQVNYGLELMAIGEVIDRVTIYGGVTFMDPKLKDTGKAASTNNQVVGVPKTQANLLVEYRMPFVIGLTPYVNLHYTGKRAANDINTSWADGYTTLDLGARYVAKVMGVETTWRLTVNNVTDKRYWSSIQPGSIDGAGGSCSAYPGDPRMILASVQFNF